MVDIVTRAGKGSPLTNNEVDANFTNLAEVSGVTGEPMGHEDRTTSTISFNASTRTFTIAPVNSSFTVWCKGKKVVVSSAQTVTIPNTSGMHSIYYDANGTLSSKIGYFTFSTEAPTAYVYWNATTGAAPYFGDERHGVVLDWQTHEYLHRTRGAAIANGFLASGYTLNNSATDAATQIAIESGTFFDEDMKIDIVSTATPTAGTYQQNLLFPAKIPVLHLQGTSWVMDAPTNFPFKQGTSRPQYNSLSGGVWSTADVGNNQHATTWILATNNLTYPVIAIIGQSATDNLGEAEAFAFADLSLTGFPSVEFRPLYKLIYKASDGYANSVNAQLVSIVDLRSISAVGSAANPATDHGNLSGLTDDDHPQYLSVDTVRSGLTAAVKASFLPSQTGNAGKFLTTDATSTSWTALTSGNITTALGFTPYNATNPAGYITGITSSNVTTALGFTPYNATNPSGFVTAAGARGAISVTGAGSYDSATGVINIVGGVTSFNTRTGAITLSSADVTTALGFTPYNNTNPNGYLTGITSTQVTTALGYTPYNSSNPSGYITGITSGMVTTALGYTPYNNSNPSGYITNSALSGYLTSASAASTYLPLTGGTLTGTVYGRGLVLNAFAAGTSGGGLELGWDGTQTVVQGYNRTSAAFTPLWLESSSLRIGINGASKITVDGSGTTTLSGVTIFNNYISLNGDFYHNGSQYILNAAQNGWINTLSRNGGNPFINNVTYAGNTILHASNYNSYAPTLTGTGASGTWGISITGNAATVTNGLVSTGSYANPSWITSLDASKLTGTLDNARVNGGTYSINISGTAATATSAPNYLPLGGGTLTGPLTIGASGNTRGVYNANGDFLSFYSTEAAARIQLGRDVGTGGGAGLALGGNTYALIGTSDTNGSTLYVKLSTNAGSVATSPSFSFLSSGFYVGTNLALHAGNYNSYSPTLTGGGASGSWGISITGSSASTTGNAATATALQTARTINGVSFNGTANITVADSTKLSLTGGSLSGPLGVGDTTTASITDQTNYSNPLVIQRSSNAGKGAVVLRGSDSIGTAIEFGRSDSASHWGTYLEFLVHDNNTSQATTGLSRKLRIDATTVTSLVNLQLGGNTLQFDQSGTRSWNMFATGGSLRTTSGDGAGFLDVTMGGGIRSPLYYDYNNTGYYLDPNGTSQILALGISSGQKITLQDANHYLRYQTTGFSGIGIDGPQLVGHQGGELGTNNGGDNWSLRWNLSGDTFSRSSSRAPIFYDSNDTGYFVNPNSGSQFSSVNLNAGLGAAADGVANDPYGFVTVTRSSAANYAYYGLTRSGQFTASLGIDTSNNFWIGGTTSGYNATRTSVWFYMNGSGDTWSNSSSRAPIFYDSNDTGRYVDPNGTTNIGALNTNGLTLLGGQIYISPQNANTLNSGYAGGTDIWINYRGQADGFTQARTFRVGDGRGTELMTVDGGGGWVGATNSLRAPIFYDSGNTAYFLNPNGGDSNLGGLTLAANVSTGRSAYGSGTANLVLLSESTYGRATIDFRSGVNYPSDGAQIYYETATNLASGETSRLVIRTENDADDSIWIRGGFIQYQATTVDGGPTNPAHRFMYGGSDRMFVYNDNTTEFGSFRAPIFYDSNDTGYYTDPNGTSRLNSMLVGNGASSDIRMTDDESPNGQKYIHANGNNIGFLSGAGSWIFRVDNGGTGIAESSLRAPIFYDYNDTGYYANPNGGSQFNTVSLAGIGANTAIGKVHSGSDFPNGTLVQTNIWAADWAGASFVMEVTGKSYSSSPPFSFMVQGYLYADTIINCSAINHGTPISYVKVFNYNNYLCFWWPRWGYWNSFEVRVRDAGGDSNNRVTSITDSALPSGSKMVEPGLFNTALYGYNQGGNLYASAYYDNNDTGYYTDPHSTSRLNYVIPSRIKLVNNVNNEPRWDFSAYVMEAQHWYGNTSTQTLYLGESNYIHVRNEMEVYSNVRAPIYYDRNDTTYYADLNSTGVSIRAAGNITAYYSDMRLKTHLGKIENAREKVRQLEGFYYEANELAQSFGYKAKREVGVSAQAVQAVLPEIVTDAPINSNYLTIDYERLTPLLIEAIKEQDTELVDLRNRVAQLESLINKLIGD